MTWMGATVRKIRIYNLLISWLYNIGVTVTYGICLGQFTPNEILRVYVRLEMLSEISIFDSDKSRIRFIQSNVNTIYIARSFQYGVHHRASIIELNKSDSTHAICRRIMYIIRRIAADSPCSRQIQKQNTNNVISTSPFTHGVTNCALQLLVGLYHEYALLKR